MHVVFPLAGVLKVENLLVRHGLLRRSACLTKSLLLLLVWDHHMGDPLLDAYSFETLPAAVALPYWVWETLGKVLRGCRKSFGASVEEVFGKKSQWGSRQGGSR